MVENHNIIKMIEGSGEKDPDVTILIPVHAEGAVTGRNILISLFENCSDKFWMKDDQLVNFMSCDHVPTTPVGRELIDNSIIE